MKTITDIVLDKLMPAVEPYLAISGYPREDEKIRREFREACYPIIEEMVLGLNDR